MRQYYRESIIRLINDITEERDLWLILRFTQLRAGKE